MSQRFNSLDRLVSILIAIGAFAFAVAQETTVAMADHPEYGTHLVDGEGLTLYLFTIDADGTSACEEACAENWPPLLVEGELVAGQGVAAALLSTIERNDGTLQATYFGIPLYRFAGDVAAGSIAGQGVNDVWFLVSNYGEAILPAEPEEEAVASNETTIEPMLLSQLMSEGNIVFTENCSACHGSSGQGGTGAGPALAGANLSDNRDVIRQVLRGSGHMPGFGHMLDDMQVASVVTFIRSSWNNTFPPVVKEEVANYR